MIDTIIESENIQTAEASKQIEQTHTSGVYTKRNLSIVRGKGAYLWDSEGKKYIDCVGGQGAANFGHANPAIARAITEQAETLVSCPEMFYHDKRAALLERLSQLTGLQRGFLCNSGTESIEAALKFARVLTGRSEIIAAMRGFHGRTFGALSATWEKKYRKPFEPLVPGFRHVPYNKIEALEKAISGETAAVILEVIQGEGGVHIGSREYLLAAQELCRKKGALLILDEVQTGFGRTGRLFAFQHYDLEPDILCLAKSLAGGVPMGATLLSNRLGDLPAMSHGATFGGNPLACAAALAALDFLVDNNLADHSAKLGNWFITQLQGIESPLIRSVRGMGLMVGMELKQKVTPYLQILMHRGVLALPAGLTVLRFLPPLVIEKNDLEEVVNVVCSTLSQNNGNEHV